MNAKRRFKSFDELPGAVQRLQEEVAQRLHDHYVTSVRQKPSSSPSSMPLEDQWGKSLFRVQSGVPLRGFGLNE